MNIDETQIQNPLCVCENLSNSVAKLGSFAGSATGSDGEERSIKYITDQVRQTGLKPGNPDGTYIQEVPLAGIKSEPRMSFAIGDKITELKYPDDFVASSGASSTGDQD